jgi:hypothetical protein
MRKFAVASRIDPRIASCPSFPFDDTDELGRGKDTRTGGDAPFARIRNRNDAQRAPSAQPALTECLCECAQGSWDGHCERRGFSVGT